MKKHFTNPFKGMGDFLLLWGSQALSALGSSMTSFALIIWSYEQEGSALMTALLTVCSYTPYVLFSVFAGAISDRWDKKKIMLACDTAAAVCTLSIFFLLKTGHLEIWHLYLINALNGLMNTFQQPASDVSVTLLVPKEQYQRIGAFQNFSGSLVSILTPAVASAVLAFAGMEAVIFFDLFTFLMAFLTLALFIRVPKPEQREGKREKLRDSISGGLAFLMKNRGILNLMWFLAAINLVASMYEAALPPMLLSRQGGGELALGWVNSCTGAANLLGSVLAAMLKTPRSRVKVICVTLFFSMSTENFLLAFGRTVPVWCLGAILGWVLIPIMSTNLNALMRSHIPAEIQGRVYAIRNSFQFFTIPLGYLLGGVLVDQVCEPLMAAQKPDSFLVLLLGSGKGSGAALLFLFIALTGIAVCVFFSRNKEIWRLEQLTNQEK